MRVRAMSATGAVVSCRSWSRGAARRAAAAAVALRGRHRLRRQRRRHQRHRRRRPGQGPRDPVSKPIADAGSVTIVYRRRPTAPSAPVAPAAHPGVVGGWCEREERPLRRRRWPSATSTMTAARTSRSASPARTAYGRVVVVFGSPTGHGRLGIPERQPEQHRACPGSSPSRATASATPWPSPRHRRRGAPVGRRAGQEPGRQEGRRRDHAVPGRHQRRHAAHHRDHALLPGLERRPRDRPEPGDEFGKVLSGSGTPSSSACPGRT